MRHGIVLTLYHQTNPELGEIILREGFKPGHWGLCGPAIYFAMDPWITTAKAVAPDSHHGFIIEARVDLGNQLFQDRLCNQNLTAEVVADKGYDSVVFNPINGNEYAIYDKRRILSMKEWKLVPDSLTTSPIVPGLR